MKREYLAPCTTRAKNVTAELVGSEPVRDTRPLQTVGSHLLDTFCVGDDEIGKNSHSHDDAEEHKSDNRRFILFVTPPEFF